MRVRVRARGRSWGKKKTENRARRLGFGGALSNGDVGGWGGVLGWCGQGGGGGGVCAFECAPGEEAGAIKKRKPSSPARVRVRPVKRRWRAMEGGGGVVWAAWWWWCTCTFKRAQGGRARAKKKTENQAIMA